MSRPPRFGSASMRWTVASLLTLIAASPRAPEQLGDCGFPIEARDRLLYAVLAELGQDGSAPAATTAIQLHSFQQTAHRARPQPVPAVRRSGFFIGTAPAVPAPFEARRLTPSR